MSPLWEHGTLAEEAARLAEALSSWQRDAGRGGARAPGGDAPGGDAPGGDAPRGDAQRAAGDGAEAPSFSGAECRICPVCQLLAMLRGVRPEVREHLLDGVASLVAAVRAAADLPSPGAAGAREPTVRAAHVEHIDIG